LREEKVDHPHTIHNADNFVHGALIKVFSSHSLPLLSMLRSL